MSEARKGPDETDESQYDSGIESLRSLRSLPESTPRPVSGPSDGGGPQPWIHPPGTAKEPEEKEDTDGERADSTYGSSSLTEPLSLSGDPRTEDAVPDSPLPAAGALSPQQLEALTYISLGSTTPELRRQQLPVRTLENSLGPPKPTQGLVPETTTLIHEGH